MEQKNRFSSLTIIIRIQLFSKTEQNLKTAYSNSTAKKVMQNSKTVPTSTSPTAVWLSSVKSVSMKNSKKPPILSAIWFYQKDMNLFSAERASGSITTSTTANAGRRHSGAVQIPPKVNGCSSLPSLNAWTISHRRKSVTEFHFISTAVLKRAVNSCMSPQNMSKNQFKSAAVSAAAHGFWTEK